MCSFPLFLDRCNVLLYLISVVNPPKRRGEPVIQTCSMLAVLWTGKELPGGTRHHNLSLVILNRTGLMIS